MALLKIARMGHPVLRQRARAVPDPADPEVQRLVADMVDTMIDAPGVGLAAPQVHVGWRVIVFRVPPERTATEAPADAADQAGGPPPDRVTALINPEIVPLGDAKLVAPEGCLSIPGLRGLVPRFARIRYRGLSPEGRQIECEASGFHARVVQHEVDHLDGILYLDRMPDLSSFMFESEMHHLFAPAGQ